ncbi:MAG TPA: hypothetical protein PK244_04305, partial [Pseudomonadales bacterium]|nr:hypothetical protein [Pseudomonadales bacterium]
MIERTPLRIFIALFLFLLFPFTANASTCSADSHCVRVGTWNIAWLGGEKRDQASDSKSIQAMADMIARQWSIDLIALQEINTQLDGEYRGDSFT